MAFIDESGEYRLLASIIDRPDTVLTYKRDLFTGERQRILSAMRESFMAYGEISTEGVERFYGRLLPPELESARGAKPGALVDRLAELATKRQLSQLINELTIIAAGNTINRDYLSRRLVLDPIMSKEDSTLAPGITNFVSDLMRKKDGQYTFVSTGLQFLDHMLGGEWPRQALTVLMGQSGGGKTALVVQSLLNMARQGLSALFISLEMPRDRLISRMVANLADVDGLRLRTGNITDEEQKRVDEALREIQRLEEYIHIIDTPGLNTEDIIYQIRFHKENHNIQAFFVDYIQIVDRTGENDVEALGKVAQLLRNTAVNLDISAVVLSQKNGQEGLQSVWGSRRIVQIADVIFEIQIDVSSTNDTSRQCKIDFLKNRDGPVGEAFCLYQPAYLRFL